MQGRTLHIGLGQIGLAVAGNLLEQGYDLAGFDVSIAAREMAKEQGIATYGSLHEALSAILSPTKLVFLAVPAPQVSDLVSDLLHELQPGDCIVDIGNSFFKDSIQRHQLCQEKGIHFVDCGLSGGVGGARYGASLLVGGESGPVQIALPVLKAIARSARCSHVGGPGAGHFSKMVHNAIEYSMMGAIAEGFYILDEHQGALDLDMTAVLEPYAEGSVISGQLLRWLRETYQEDEGLLMLSSSVPAEQVDIDMDYLTRHEVARILDAALTQRKLTRIEPSVIGRIINGMRIHFGDAIGPQKDNIEYQSVGRKKEKND